MINILDYMTDFFSIDIIQYTLVALTLYGVLLCIKLAIFGRGKNI